MQSRFTLRTFKLGQPGMAALLIGVWLAMNSLAACPQLHQLLHQDSQTVGHFCQITHVSKSPWLFDGGNLIRVPAPIALFDCSAVSGFAFPAISNHRLAGSRAPPTDFSPRRAIG